MNMSNRSAILPDHAPNEVLRTSVFLRRVARLAELLRDHWEEGSGFDTRFFQEPFIHDPMVMRGISTQGGEHREHIVPRAYLRDRCLEMYENGASVAQVQQAIVKHLGIVRISRAQAYYLDHELHLKTTMPDGWRFGVDDPMARITKAGIDLQAAQAASVSLIPQTIQDAPSATTT